MSRTHALAAVLGVLALAAAAAPPAPQSVQVDRRFAPYRPTQGVTGNIKSVGSDTMNNLMTLWAEKFAESYPNVAVEVEGKGSSTAPAALRERAANFGPMSRPMKQEEMDEFEGQIGYPPTGVAAAVDMLAVYVHKDNPIARAGLTLAQVDAIFSKNRNRKHKQDIRTWGDLGLTDEGWADKPISLYGRNSASGTYGFFKEHALAKGDFKDSVKEQPGSSSVVSSVGRDRYAIGYSGIGYKTADVRAVPLAEDERSSPIEATLANVDDYPLSRHLLIYLDYKKGTELDPLRREFLKLVFSREGQEVVVKDGYIPVSFERAKEDLRSVGIRLDERPSAPTPTEAGTKR